MTRNEFCEDLKNLDFFYEREDEFHRDNFFNDHFKLVTNDLKSYKLSLVVYVDRYTVRIIWWLDNTHKVGKSYYMNKDVNDCESAISLLASCVYSLADSFKIDMNDFLI